jgi:hypothetical protein
MAIICCRRPNAAAADVGAAAFVCDDIMCTCRESTKGKDEYEYANVIRQRVRGMCAPFFMAIKCGVGCQGVHTQLQQCTCAQWLHTLLHNVCSV